MRNILVTGPTGFIGQRLVRAISDNIRVISREKQSNYETIVCDFEKEDIPKSALEFIDTVFHTAGFAHDFRNGDEIEHLCNKVNVNATLQLAELAVKSGVKKFIFVSSVKAGGNADSKICRTEKDQGEPEGIYGKSKLEAELKLLKIGIESGMHVSIVRPALVYGPDLKGNLKLMLSGIERGWFPPLPKTGNKRSMIHVDDLVRAIILVSEAKKTNGEIFIATDGSPYSSYEIYNTMRKILGKPASKWSVPKIFFDIAGILNPRIKLKVEKIMGDECYSSEKLEKLGFKAKKTLREMNETSF